ncbi:hypothetical protein FRC17_000191 [Serendipita sp. 399]|nr:hypothetical protein FRC17_000191 [Serendipita sp. 399]
MSGAVAILRRLWYRDGSTTSSSSPSSATNSPSDKVFPSLEQRGSVASDHSMSSRTSSPNRLVRALSSKLRPRSKTANGTVEADSAPRPEVIETLNYRRPKSAHSSLSLNGLVNWGRSPRPITKKPSETEFGVRSCVSHNDAPTGAQLSPNSPLLAAFFPPSPKAPLLTIPNGHSTVQQNLSTETLQLSDAEPLQKQRSHSLPVDAILRTELPLEPAKVDQEISAEAVVVPFSPVSPGPTPPPKDHELPKEEEAPAEPLPNIMEMLSMVEHRLSKLNYGAINILAHYNGVSPTYSWTPLGWDASRGVPLPAESPKFVHPAFQGMLVEAAPGLERLSELDVESQAPGRLAGTTTVAGLGWERWEVASRGRRQTVYFMQGALPPLSGPELVQKLQNVKRTLDPANAAEEASLLRGIIGQASSTFFDSERPYNSQAADLIRVINREDLFEDFTLADSVYLLAIAPPPTGMGVRLFLLQMLLGYELYLRLKVCDNASSFPGITQQVNSTLEIAVRWVDNVSTEIVDGELKVYSKVHEQQVEGLIAFAEAMQWPALEEVRRFAKTAYSDHLGGQIVNVHFLDWLYGTFLPGRWFAWKCMSAAIYASPSLRSYGTTPYYDAGLVLKEHSYWRRRTPLAHVFGGLPAAKSVAGWVGPCPPMKTVDGKLFTGWIRIKSRPAEFNHLAVPGDEMTEDQHELQDRGLRVRPGETPRGLLNELADMTKWIFPPAVPKSITKPQLIDVTLDLLPIGEEDDVSGQYADATVAFDLGDGGRTQYNISHNPVFVSSPPCISGPHLAHSRELERYQNVVDVKDLKKYGLNSPGKILLINASGGGDAEAVARAWCSEAGRHAVISRSNMTCLTCSFNTTENLELDLWGSTSCCRSKLDPASTSRISADVVSGRMNRRNSRIRRTLSWITGSGAVNEESEQLKSDFKAPDSLRSFLPSLKKRSAYSQRRASTSSTVTCSTQTQTSLYERPPPFFYPRAPTCTQEEQQDVSLIDAEVSLFGGRLGSHPFAGLEAFLNRKKLSAASITCRIDVSQEAKKNSDTTMISEDKNFSSFVVYEDQTAESRTPELSYSKTSSSDGDNLQPPPRPNRKSISSTLAKFRGSIRRRRSSPGIDPAKWAEISISAADLIRNYGRENVFFPHPTRISIDSLDEDSGVLVTPGEESFVDLSDESLLGHHPVDHGGFNANGRLLEGSSFVSSLNASMASFSKWPLPPHCNHFESNHVPS